MEKVLAKLGFTSSYVIECDECKTIVGRYETEKEEREAWAKFKKLGWRDDIDTFIELCPRCVEDEQTN